MIRVMLFGCLLCAVLTAALSEDVAACLGRSGKIITEKNGYYFAVLNDTTNFVMMENGFRLLRHKLNENKLIIIGSTAAGRGVLVIDYNKDNTTEKLITCDAFLHDLYSRRGQDGTRDFTFECGQPAQVINNVPFIEAKMAADISPNWKKEGCFSSSGDVAVWILGNSPTHGRVQNFEELTKDLLIETTNIGEFCYSRRSSDEQLACFDSNSRYILYICSTAGFLCGEFVILMCVYWSKKSRKSTSSSSVGH